MLKYTVHSVCVLTSHSANSTAVHTLFTSSKANGLVLSNHCGFDGLQDGHLFPRDVRSWQISETTGLARDSMFYRIYNKLHHTTFSQKVLANILMLLNNL